MFLLDLQLLRTLMTKSEWVTVASFIWENFSSASLQSLRQRVLVRNTARPSKTQQQPSSRWGVKKEVSISIKFLQVHQNLPVFFPRTKSQNHWVDPHVSEEPSISAVPLPQPPPPARPLAGGQLEMAPGLGVGEDTHILCKEPERWAIGKFINMSAVYFTGRNTLLLFLNISTWRQHIL